MSPIFFNVSFPRFPEVVAERKSCDGHAAAKTDLKTKLYCEFTGLDMVTDCSIAEKNLRLVADNTDDEEATIQVQQDDVQEGKHPLRYIWISGSESLCVLLNVV